MPSAMGSSEGRVSDGVALAAWPDAETIHVAAGDELPHEGERSDDVFQVVTGTFEVLRGPRKSRIDVVGPGALLGDVAALTGTPRRATIRALEAAVVRRIDRAGYQRWMAEDARRLDELIDLARLRIDRHAAISVV